jgi:hypothetical protein
MNIQSKSISAVGHEAMRIAGKQVDLDDRIEVRTPYNGACRLC